MQSKLPDINSAIVTHRNAMLRAYDKKDFEKIVISYRAINGLLPEDYKLEISTEKYRKEIKIQTLIECPKCNESSNLNDVKFLEFDLPENEQILQGKKSNEVWFCPLCKTRNLKRDTHTEELDVKDPTYYKIIPNPPIRKSILDRPYFDLACSNWLFIAIPELENQIQLYRAEYIANSGDDDFDDGDDQGEEGDG